MRKLNFLDNYQKGYYDIIEDAIEKPPAFWTRAGLKYYLLTPYWQEFLEADFRKKLTMLRGLTREQKFRLMAASAIVGILVGILFAPGKKVPELPHDVTQQMVDRARMHEIVLGQQGVPVGSFTLRQITSPYLPAQQDPQQPKAGRLQIYYSFEAERAQAVVAEISRTLGWNLQVEEGVTDRFGFRVIVEGYGTMQMAESLRRELKLDHVVRREDKYYPASGIFFNKASAEELAENIRYHRAMIVSDFDKTVVYSVLTPPLEQDQITPVVERLRLLGYRPIRIT
ncbi:hypothetical protein LGV61_04405 [Desulfurispirillum indicum]|uniref:Sporulation domain-containing protein n=1 Tax=Desulfurispirillum indicum (strain ATCC BAA-1389 / DSM 22839 / S5) TaxID=653733 RepID=E6W2Q4_DESIS|nr:hypothetical protein [Desulfurispirillum indicum]ADU65638.1 hypothetical protein Selin_0898 [Desulfurispirillum indicum S5]UCZ57527.1 hypothetical protein LGV61_04405 [Desulfurispirillum indicum]